MQHPIPAPSPTRRVSLLLAAPALLAVAVCLSAGPGACTRTERPSLERARQAGVIRVGFANEPPYAYLDPETGELAGEAPEVARMVLRELGIERVEGVLVEFGSLIPGLQAGRFDMIAAGMYITPERCAAVAFSEPTYCIGEAFLVRAGNPLGLASYEDVREHATARLGVVSGTVEVSYAREIGIPEDRIVVFPDMASAAAGILADRVDAAAGTGPTVADLHERLGAASGLEPADPFEQPVIEGVRVLGCGAFGFRRDDVASRDAFDAVLESVIGTPRHLGAVEPHGFGSPTLPPSGVTRDLLCAGG